MSNALRQKIYNIIEPDINNSIKSKFYDKIMIVAILVSLVPLLFRKQCTMFLWIEYFATMLFFFDYLMRWITADMRSKNKQKYAFLLYPFTLNAIFDLLSILPIISYFNSSLRIFRVYRLFRLFRVFKVFRYYEPLQIVLEVLKKKSEILLTVVCFALFYVLITALFMFNVEDAVNPETGQLFFGSYFDAVYWASCTLTTVGYGDIYPISSVGRLVSMFSSLVGIAIIALPSGIITAGYMEEVQQRKDNVSKKE